MLFLSLVLQNRQVLAQQKGHIYKIGPRYIIFHTSNNFANYDNAFTLSKPVKASLSQNSLDPSKIIIDFRVQKLERLTLVPSADLTKAKTVIDSVSTGPSTSNVTVFNLNPITNTNQAYFYYQIQQVTGVDIPKYYISAKFSTFDIGLLTIPLKYRFGKTISNKDTVDLMLLQILPFI